MAKIVDWFITIIIVQLFFSMAINGYLYTLPEEMVRHVSSFDDVVGNIDTAEIGQDLESSIQSQTNIPVVDVGALVFYSGNILLDLLANFALAIPTMIGLLVNGIVSILNIDVFFVGQVQLFAVVAIMAVYFIGLIQLITGIRSGRIA